MSLHFTGKEAQSFYFKILQSKVNEVTEVSRIIQRYKMKEKISNLILNTRLVSLTHFFA